MREDCLTKSVLAVFVMAMVSVSLHFYAVSRREAKIRSREVKFNAEEKGKNREEEDKLNKKLFKAWILIIALKGYLDLFRKGYSDFNACYYY